MGLLDDLNKATDETEPACPACKALETLPDNEAKALERALSSKLGALRLSRILRENGISVSVPSIHTHRQKGHSR